MEDTRGNPEKDKTEGRQKYTVNWQRVKTAQAEDETQVKKHPLLTFLVFHNMQNYKYKT